MTIKEIVRALSALSPSAKMELADRLYDAAVGEADRHRSRRRRGPRSTAGVDAPLVAGPAVDPWSGFSERRLGR